MNWLDVDGAIVSHVKERRILISPETIETVLNVRNTGSKLFCLTKWLENNDELDLSYHEAIVTICDNIHELKKNKPTHAALGHKWAQLHRIISHYIFPTNGSFEKVSFMDTLLLYCLIYNWPMNFGYTMTKAIYEIAVTAKDTFLPFAMFLTCFFKHFKVNLDNEVSEPVNRVLLGRRPPSAADPTGKGKGKKTVHDDDSDDDFQPPAHTTFAHNTYHLPKAFKEPCTYKLKEVMKELVTELISFTEMQRFMFSSLSKEHNTFAQNMQEASDKWRMIESHLRQVPSDDEQPLDDDEDIFSDP